MLLSYAKIGFFAKKARCLFSKPKNRQAVIFPLFMIL